VADLSGVTLERVDSVEKAFALMRWLGERHETDAIGFDIETGEYKGNPTDDALSPYHGHVRLAQIGDQNTGWAIPWDEWSGVFYEAMSKWEGQIITHNIAFEAKWMAETTRFRMPWERSHDTMIQAHIVDPLGPGALKVLTSRYVELPLSSRRSTRPWPRTVGRGAPSRPRSRSTGRTVRSTLC
jgi:hypothetical protein